ncbi:diheme cytochrome c [Terasakiella pusilla]|uniref:diheme cytochrome c n=1 Tax=Terasakiella pusilla TaxID=64973 RepID=UPI003AA86F69
MGSYKKIFMALTLTSLIGTAAHADERYRPVQDEVVKKECGSCHMAFQPQMLPKRSWQKIMDGLENHFGEDASLDEATLQHVRAYLTDNAADSGWFGGKMMRGVRDNETPMRITELPYWVREHKKEVPVWAWSDPKVKSKTNCQACHRDAERGYYDDD